MNRALIPYQGRQDFKHPHPKYGKYNRGTDMNTTSIYSALVISALLALAVFAAPVAATGASFNQLNSFSRLNGISSGAGTGPVIPSSSGLPADILPVDPLTSRTFSSTAHNLGPFTIQPYVPNQTAAEFSSKSQSSSWFSGYSWNDLFGPRLCGCGGC